MTEDHSGRVGGVDRKAVSGSMSVGVVVVVVVVI
jgi:hypothetical protein